MTIRQQIIFALLLAIGSFIIGSALFAAFYLTNSISIAFTSYFIVLVLGLINFIVLFRLLNKIKKHPSEKSKILGTATLMLCNIPVVWVYIHLISVLMNTMRITFINDTGKPLTEIKIIGCEYKTIEKLAPKARKDVWVGITGDCSIHIEYIIDHSVKSEWVYAYVTNSNGQIATYRIGTDKQAVEKKD